MRSLFAVLRRRSRQRRYDHIRHLMHVESLPGLVLDLGGGPASFFATLFQRFERTFLVEVDGALASAARARSPKLAVIVADGQRLPLADASVALTVCNSVIEHVDDPAALAAEICRVSRSYFLQTPSGTFPFELHSFVPIPFYPYVPWARLRRVLCRVFGARHEYLDSVRYLREQDLRGLFPGASVAREQCCGLTKSLYVYSPASGSENDTGKRLDH